MDCLFSLLIISLIQKHSEFWQNLFIYFSACACYETSNLISWSLPSSFSPRSFIFVSCILRSLMHFGVCVCVWFCVWYKLMGNFFILNIDVKFIQHCLLKRLTFPHKQKTNQSDLHLQLNFIYANIIGGRGSRKTNPKMHLELQRTLTGQNNLKTKKSILENRK